jgi:hypothetical protein
VAAPLYAANLLRASALGVHWTVRITGAVDQGVVFEMVGRPFDSWPLYGHRAKHEQRGAYNG